VYSVPITRRVIILYRYSYNNDYVRPRGGGTWRGVRIGEGVVAGSRGREVYIVGIVAVVFLLLLLYYIFFTLVLFFSFYGQRN